MSLLENALHAGVLTAEELANLQSIYDRVCAEQWFPQDIESRRAFASYVLNMYRRGMVIPERLEALCRVAARTRFADTSPTTIDLTSRRFLLVEDEYFLACEAADELVRSGAEVVGPTGSVQVALEFLESDDIKIDAALLDISLQGEMVFPVAAILKMKHIPFAFISGHDRSIVPTSYRHAPKFTKPANWTAIAADLVKGKGPGN